MVVLTCATTGSIGSTRRLSSRDPRASTTSTGSRLRRAGTYLAGVRREPAGAALAAGALRRPAGAHDSAVGGLPRGRDLAHPGLNVARIATRRPCSRWIDAVEQGQLGGDARVYGQVRTTLQPELLAELE